MVRLILSGLMLSAFIVFPVGAAWPPAAPVPAAPSGSAAATQSPAAPSAPIAAPAASTDPAVYNEWLKKIRLIEIRSLRAGVEKDFQEGRNKVLEIADEAAIGPMVQVLYGTNTRYRGLLVESLAKFASDGSAVAKAYLQEIAVGDGNAGQRHTAIESLKRASGDRPTERLMAHLALDDVPVLRDHAATALASLGEKNAVWLLVERLVTEDVQLVGAEIVDYHMTLTLIGQMCGVPTFRRYQVTAAVPGGIATTTIELPEVAITDFKTTIAMSDPGHVMPDYQRVQVQHPEILAALRALTGKDLGYNQEAWRQWLRSPDAAKIVPPWEPVQIKAR